MSGCVCGKAVMNALKSGMATKFRNPGWLCNQGTPQQVNYLAKVQQLKGV